MVYGENCIATYIEEDNRMGFIKEHVYKVIVEKAKHGVELSVYYDKTLGKEFVKENIPYSNAKSLQEFWEFKEE